MWRHLWIMIPIANNNPFREGNGPHSKMSDPFREGNGFHNWNEFNKTCGHHLLLSLLVVGLMDCNSVKWYQSDYRMEMKKINPIQMKKLITFSQQFDVLGFVSTEIQFECGENTWKKRLKFFSVLTFLSHVVLAEWVLWSVVVQEGESWGICTLRNLQLRFFVFLSL